MKSDTCIYSAFGSWAGGAWPFLGIPLREFTDQVVGLDTIMGRETRICVKRFTKLGMTIRALIC